MTTHRMTVQFDARLHFDLNLPHDDAALVRDQTLLTVLIEPANDDETCASYVLKLRVGGASDDSHGTRGDSRDGLRELVQAEFVHRSAAEGAGQCLLQYLLAKKDLNVAAKLVTEPHGHLPSDKQTFTAVGWSMSKHEPHAPPVIGATQALAT